MYTMEELVPLVGRLAEKYCAYGSSSVTYEKAEQLMGAVLYCIHEAENTELDMTDMSDMLGTVEKPVMDTEKAIDNLSLRRETVPAATGSMSAEQAYEKGIKLVKQKTENTLTRYNHFMQKFDWYGSKCLHDTMVKGMPEFFKWYDCQMEPQNTVLMLDYPVLRDLSGLTGIDKIAAFLECIRLEQIFLGRFPKDYVRTVLSGHNRMYEEMIENICENVLISVLGHVMAKQPLAEWKLAEEDHLRIQAICGQRDTQGIRELLEDAVDALVTEYFDSDMMLSSYLKDAVEDIAVRLKYAAVYGETESLF